MNRRHALVLAIGLSPFTFFGCSSSDDGATPSSTTSDDAGATKGPGSGEDEGDASAPNPDGSVTPPSPPTYESYEQAKAALDAKAILGAEVFNPTNPFWCSENVVFWSGSASKSAPTAVHSWNPSTQKTIDYSFNAGGVSSLSGTDERLAVAPPASSDLSLYRVSDPPALLEMIVRTGMRVPLGVHTFAGGVISVTQEGTGNWEVRRWDAVTKATTSVATKPGYSTVGPVFSNGRILLVNKLERFILDLTHDPVEIASLSVDSAGFERPSAFGLLVASGKQDDLTLYAQNQNTPATKRSLGAEIAAIPPLYADTQGRNLHNFTNLVTSSGDYLIYQGVGGIFAYDTANKAVYPVQPGQGAFALLGCVTSASRTLAFISSDATGFHLRAVKLADVLP